MVSNVKRQIPELLASVGDSGVSSNYLPLSHSICCKLCLSIFKQAKILPCLHSFCHDCLQAYARKSSRNIKERQLLCPTCQEYNKLPGTGIKGLLDNTLIDQSIASNVPTLALRKKEGPLFPGLYSTSDDSYEVHVKHPDQGNTGDTDVDHDNPDSLQWQHFMHRQRYTETDDKDRTDIQRPIHISEALKGLSDEERLERLTNSLKNTFSFSQALQEHELKLESDVRALRTSSSSSEYSFTQRDFMQEQLGSLQTEAMNIIYRLDGLNTSGDTWERNRSRVEQQIHTQVEEMIGMLRQIEKTMLNQIDSYAEHQDSINPVWEGKQQLQALLRNILGVIEFIRMVLRYGSTKDFELYEKLVSDRCDNLLKNPICIEKTSISFTAGKVLEQEFEKVLGFLTFSSSSEEIWKYKDNEINVDNAISSDSVFSDLMKERNSSEFYLRNLPPSFSREFLQTTSDMSDSVIAQSFTPDSLSGDETEQQKLTVDQLIHKFSTEFGMRYNEIIPDDSSSNPMTSSRTSDNPYPSPIPEEMNGNGSVESETLITHSKFKPRSAKRRHTVSDVQQDLAHARIDLSDNRYRGLVRGRKTSIPEMMTGLTEKRPLTNDLEQTKRILALCKRQLLEAKSMGIHSNKGVTSPEHRLSRSTSMSQSASQGVTSPEHKLSRSTSMSQSASLSRDHTLKSPPERKLPRSSSASHDYVQQIRTRLGLDRPLSPSTSSIDENK